MKTIQLKKIRRADLEVLQQELEQYAEIQRLGYHFWTIDEFLNAIIAVDIAHALWIKLRNKLENDNAFFTMTFKLNEASVLMKCCYWQRAERTQYQKNVAEKYKNIIDQKLKSIIPVAH
ncbi:hypothetical protein [Flavobacterium sp. AG291]|uniref:hypothetical protein n=1 Tax=Flavobacterium sp. AG291 TaxID=2184000 RepID=UPI000E0AD18B|nr:hypothetical protein [Flavobacterium sp. AG291]RDI07063.1 hypothetical protein DEU42_113163 [Flavobacterium sp. AG291]